MHPALIVVCTAPVVILLLAGYLSSLYGDKLFGLDWPGHDLNNPDDPRILKLSLEDHQDDHRSSDDSSTYTQTNKHPNQSC